MQVEIDLEAIFDTPLNIGTGTLAESIADKPLVKDANRSPLIPGSTLKGKVRHECERIIRVLIVPWPEDWDCKAPYPDQMCRDSNICPICRIFGAPWHPSPIIFENLTLEIAAKGPLRNWKQLHSIRGTDLRTGVGINRERGVAEDELLYSTETFCPHPALVYQGHIKGSLQERKEVALLLAGLRSVPALGGSRSRGLGWWHLELSVKLDGQSTPVDELLQEVGKWQR
jgi:CRISPR/Cas system CSM-associated protein Csm3 (group 7 of RAMP superfamily)